VEADLERRFGGLRRLYGEAAYERLRALRVAVVGLGGVGSWTVEALARSGVAGLVLVDLDQVAESNINRQVQALTGTLGQAKAQALSERVADIHPGCEVNVVEEFAGADNWPGLLPGAVDALVDACDQVRAKVALAHWALASGVAFVTVGAAGGKRQPQRLEVADLAEVTHDPLLASVRRGLRRRQRDASTPAAAGHGAHRRTRGVGDRSSPAALGVRCVFSREAVHRPADCEVGAGLACHGYGSSVMVTAAFGLAAAAEVVEQAVARPGARAGAAAQRTGML
jgi:tRNA A37 threonylcarbamoyladenosine dehydratase